MEASTPQLDPVPGVLAAGRLHVLAGTRQQDLTALTVSVIKWHRAGPPIFRRLPNQVPCIAYIAAGADRTAAQRMLDGAACPDVLYYSVEDNAGQPVCLSDPLTRLDSAVRALARQTSSSSLPDNTLLIADSLDVFLGGDLRDYERTVTHFLRLTL